MPHRSVTGRRSTRSPGKPIFEDQPHTWTYDYLRDRQYDEFLDTAGRSTATGSTTEYTFDPETRWLERQQSISPNRSVGDAAYTSRSRTSTTRTTRSATRPSTATPSHRRLPASSSAPPCSTTSTTRSSGWSAAAGIYELPNKRHQRYALSLPTTPTATSPARTSTTPPSRSPCRRPPSFGGPVKGELPNAQKTYASTASTTRPTRRTRRPATPRARTTTTPTATSPASSKRRPTSGSAGSSGTPTTA